MFFLGWKNGNMLIVQMNKRTARAAGPAWGLSLDLNTKTTHLRKDTIF